MSQKHSNTVEECPACESESIDTDIDGFDGVCVTCGVVIHDASDPESLDWMITEADADEPPADEWEEVSRIRNATEKRVADAFSTLENFAEQLGISEDTRREVATIYSEAAIGEITSGRDTDSVVGACLRLASTRLNKPIPQSRITDLLGVDVSLFRSSLSVLHKQLDKQPPAPLPGDYVSFIAAELDLAESETRETEAVLKSVDCDSALTGKDPAAVAAAAAYLAVADITQASAAEAVGVSTETIRLRKNQLRSLVTDA